MQLIRVLLIAASIIVILSAISIFFGSSRQEKTSAIRFFIAAIGACVWTIAITIFLNMPNASPEFAHIVVVCIIGGVTLCEVGLLAYLSWQHKGGKVATIIFAMGGATLVAMLAVEPSLFYSSVDTSQEYTHLYLSYSWYYFTLIAFFVLISITFSSFLQRSIKKSKNKGLKTGLKVFYVGLTIGGILSLLFNLVFITSLPQLTWIGPMTTIISILSFYYAVVRYRTISLSSKWMEVMSYTIMITAATIVYLLIFYIVFTSIFGIPNPTQEVLLLNIIMAIILLLLTPTIVEIVNFMKANYLVEKIELGYVSKKLEAIDRTNFDPRDVAKFLSDTMHYSFIMFIINGHSYASNDVKLSIEEVADIAKAKASEGSIWIKPNPENTHEHEISKIGIFTNENGKEIGKIVFGKHLGSVALPRRELVKQEEIIGIVSCIIEEKGKTR